MLKKYKAITVFVIVLFFIISIIALFHFEKYSVSARLWQAQVNISGEKKSPQTHDRNTPSSASSASATSTVINYTEGKNSPVINAEGGHVALHYNEK